MDELDLYFYYKHYIEVDSNSNILFGWSDGPTQWKTPNEKTICITEQGSYQFRLFPDGEENPQFLTPMGIPLYHYDSVAKEITRRSDEEVAEATAALPPSPPSEMDKLIANVEYIAIMSDIDLDT